MLVKIMSKSIDYKGVQKELSKFCEEIKILKPQYNSDLINKINKIDLDNLIKKNDTNNIINDTKLKEVNEHFLENFSLSKSKIIQNKTEDNKDNKGNKQFKSNQPEEKNKNENCINKSIKSSITESRISDGKCYGFEIDKEDDDEEDSKEIKLKDDEKDNKNIKESSYFILDRVENNKEEKIEEKEINDNDGREKK